MGETETVCLTDLCIVTAVDIEFKIAVKLLSEKSVSEGARMKICRGLFGSRRVTVLQSQIGAARFAERLSKHLVDNRYDALVVVGLAGGLDLKLRAGDAVLYDLCYDARSLDFGHHEQTAHEKSVVIASDAVLSNFLYETLKISGLSCIRGAGITVSRIVTEAKDKLALGARYGAAAVDMETYEALSACDRLNLRAAALRIISDEAGRGIPDFNQAYAADGRMIKWRMAVAMMAHPVVAFRFLLSLRRALKSLKENLRAVLNA
ncbi:MAG: hypothetical protein AB7U82_33735 [Blastocatellales bacterium]